MHRPRGTLAARTIGKSYGETVVLDGLSLAVTPSSRIGVVGPNGIGKSTLLRLLAGVEEPDSGAVTREPPGLSVAYLVQERAVEGLSGGEAARRNLEAILAADADVLLLDEPTNDLDFAGLELLERFLASHRGGVVAVSHDRAFLERMTTHRRARGRDAAGARLRRRLERVRRPARGRARAARVGVRGLRLRARAARGAGAPDAAVGGARLRPGPQEEEVEGREEGRGQEARPARAGREAVDALAAAALARAGFARRRRGRAARPGRSSSATASASARSTSSCATATGSRCSAATARARRRC